MKLSPLVSLSRRHFAEILYDTYGNIMFCRHLALYFSASPLQGRTREGESNVAVINSSKDSNRELEIN